MILRNRHPGAWAFRLIFALAQIVDGVVRLLSFGVLATQFPVTVSKHHAKSAFTRMKKLRDGPQPPSSTARAAAHRYQAAAHASADCGHTATRCKFPSHDSRGSTEVIRPKPSTPFSVFERSIIAKATSARDALHQLKKAQIARPFGSVRAAWETMKNGVSRAESRK